MKRDLSYWEDLAERYFLAETTEAEEARLRRFLCTDEARDARFDELRATMSYLHVARTAKEVRSSSPLLGRGRGRLFPWKGQGRLAIAVAACLLIAFLGWHQYRQYSISSVRMAGEYVEDADASLLMQEQMTAMFNPPTQ